MMKYKGYVGVVEYDNESKVLSGEVAGTRAVIHFQSTSAKQVEKEFRNSVDFYLESCAKRGRQPEKPFSGKFALRMSEELHRRAFLQAKSGRKSLNAWLVSLIERATKNVA
ncbi:MAG: type II toxin-antitoxin system HicB family antitoxin [Deltaproteobacteria bacterium]|nr:type II toxin-antitoxin system HicB family antitoxin [Deltaproteobacteria bacterium]